MALNPATKQGSLNNPTTRANELNDPQFSENQGYFPYDLTHQSFITPKFGEITPSLILDTVPGDRIVVRDNQKLILNRINGNFLSNLNQYIDTFYIPLRSVYPENYEKMIVNKTKGDDIPNSALPMFPLGGLINDYLLSDTAVTYIDVSDNVEETVTMRELTDAVLSETGLSLGDYPAVVISSYYSRLTLLATVLSRGQLLDYMNYQLDLLTDDTLITSLFQAKIDDYFNALYDNRYSYLIAEDNDNYVMLSNSLDLELDQISIQGGHRFAATTLEEWRQAISDILEKGEMIDFRKIEYDEDSGYYDNLKDATRELVQSIINIFSTSEIAFPETYINTINESANPFADGSYINIGRILAYQQVVAQYFTNDTIDNIYNSDLYMQLLRAVMYPSIDGFSSEPTFDYNGVATEYDYISTGGAFHSLISDKIPGHLNRQYVFMTLMFLMRRSLRFGDYFSTARPNMLAIGQLGVNVENGAVSPIDITKNLLMQRYLNACNRIGNGFLQSMASLFSITPSDTGTFPRFISHRKIEIQNQITNNTSEEQGKQTTNLVGYVDESACDVFIDDFGYLISVVSFDVLPVYTTGIDSTWHFSDRFDYFNPMLQNIGDQPIRSSELLGNPELYNSTFGYVVRNGEYKFALSKAHGAFCNNELAGVMFKYPINDMRTDFEGGLTDLKINPDYIRDKAIYLDKVIPANSGLSPASYFQFVISCTNEVHAARKIQATPPVLF